MDDLPGGTVTFLFTDIEGSTKLFQKNPGAMPDALARHNALLRQAIETNGGYVFQIVGDAFCAECRRLSVEHNLMRSPTLTRFRNGFAEACLLAAEQNDETERGSWLKKAKSACQVALKQGKAYRPGLPEEMECDTIWEGRIWR